MENTPSPFHRATFTLTLHEPLSEEEQAAICAAAVEAWRPWLQRGAAVHTRWKDLQ